jgi:segregation and condensation protein B
LNLTQVKATVEALIFAASEPINVKTIAGILEIDEHTVKQLILDLTHEYQEQNRGIRIVAVANGYQFCTKSECAVYLEKLQRIPRNVGLSRAAVETLAIIAYKQPVTKGEIEALRGVNIESPLNTLLEKLLVEEAGRKEVAGRPILYRTTNKFLQYFGLNSLSDLPAIAQWFDSGTLQFAGETLEVEEHD